MRKLLIELVLATDMKQHFALLGHFSSAFLTTDIPSIRAGASKTASTVVSPDNSCGPSDSGCGTGSPPAPAGDSERLLALQV
jgi:hypothetical protein